VDYFLQIIGVIDAEGEAFNALTSRDESQVRGVSGAGQQGTVRAFVQCFDLGLGERP
jgi:hypothetical protein